MNFKFRLLFDTVEHYWMRGWLLPKGMYSRSRRDIFKFWEIRDNS